MKKYIASIIALSTILSCSVREDIPTSGTSGREEGVMYFEPLYPGITKATETAFEQGDVIGLYVTDYQGETAPPLQISGNWANNVSAAFDGMSWTTSKKIFWSEGLMDVYGYYPYMTPVSIDEQPFSVALDQSVPESDGKLSGYEASDFLWCKVAGVDQTSTETVELRFRHCLSKFVVQMVKGPSYEGDFPEDAELYIHSTVPVATIDFTTGSVTKDLFGEMATIKARKVNDSTFEAIIVPQRLDTRRPFVELIAGGVSYLLEDTFQFRPGMQHTLYLTINSNPDQIEIEIGGDIEDGEWS